jgi:hypothetical protein
MGVKFCTYAKIRNLKKNLVSYSLFLGEKFVHTHNLLQWMASIHGNSLTQVLAQEISI